MNIPNEIIKMTLDKLHSGDHITDEELSITVKSLSPILDLIRKLGEQYHLFWKELYTYLAALKSYQQARKEKG